MAGSQSTPPINLLVLSDHDSSRRALVSHFLPPGYETQEAVDVNQAVEVLVGHAAEVAILDLNASSHQELIARLAEIPAVCALIVLVELDSHPVPATKVDPFARCPRTTPPADIELLVQRAAQQRRLESENARLRDLLKHREHKADMTDRADGDTDDLCAIERRKVVEVLRREGGNKARTARALRIDRRKIYRLIEKYAIGEGEIRPSATPVLPPVCADAITPSVEPRTAADKPA